MFIYIYVGLRDSVFVGGRGGLLRRFLRSLEDLQIIYAEEERFWCKKLCGETLGYIMKIGI